MHGASMGILAKPRRSRTGGVGATAGFQRGRERQKAKGSAPRMLANKSNYKRSGHSIKGGSIGASGSQRARGTESAPSRDGVANPAYIPCEQMRRHASNRANFDVGGGTAVSKCASQPQALV
jgi:hypothetical protein